MKKIEQRVPEGIRFISEWQGYRIPEGHCIIDKDVCGCGYTEYCISPGNRDPVILCSPRIALLENKASQHQGDPGLYYYQSELLKSEFEGSQGEGTSEHNRSRMDFVCGKIQEHYQKCAWSGIPAKFMCTYDSFHTIKEALGDAIRQFRVVVDEFQSIFLDAFFKASVENSFFTDLQGVPNVAYLSATPMLDRYLGQVPGFDQLPFYRLVWPESAVTKARIYEKQTGNLVREAVDIIKSYRDPKRVLWKPVKIIDGVSVFSEEVVFYVNSVNMIKDIINRAGLGPEEVNIVCSKTKSNARILRKIKNPGKFEIGHIPLRGEPHKMFTFCTRTAYLGADFYSPTATTVVLSDANITSLVLDISLDLPQILGRQRLDSNPWKNEATVFYKTLSKDNEITEERFREYVEAKSVLTDRYLEFARSLPSGSLEIEISISFSPLRVSKGLTGRYCSISGSSQEIVYNPFLKLAEQRAWELSQRDYKSSVTVIKSIGDTKNLDMVTTYSTRADTIVQAVIDKIKSLPWFETRLELYCSFREQYKDDQEVTQRALIYYNGTDYENIYSVFGLSGARASKFRATNLQRKLRDHFKKSSVQDLIRASFTVGSRYLRREIKDTLRGIYDRSGLESVTAKATDLGDIFELSQIKMTDPATGRLAPGFLVIRVK